MSTEKDKQSLPPEARRRGGMDTLFSAAWFDEDAAKAGNTPGGSERVGAAAPSSSGQSIEPEAPKKSNTTMFVVIGVVVLLVLGGLACTGVAGVVGALYYVRLAAGSAG